MTQKLLIEFLVDFVHNESVRCETLRNEFTGPAAYGLDQSQVDILNTFDLDAIMAFAGDELRALGIDLAAKQIEVAGNPGSVGFGTMNAAAASMYAGGQIHVRKLDPTQIQATVPTVVTVLGNGFDAQPEVQFSLAGQIVQGTVQSASCDVDLYQRLKVNVTLPTAGDWTVQARNPPDPNWNTKDVGTLKVIV